MILHGANLFSYAGGNSRYSKVLISPGLRSWLVGAAIILTALGALLVAESRCLYVYAFQMDGVLQTSSMEYRLAAGFLPGRDFFPYLGLGPLYVLFPVFFLLGKTVVAANTAAYFCTFCSWAFEITILATFTFRIRNYQLIGLIFAALLSLFSILPSTILFLTPGFSLRPIRTIVAFGGIGALLMVVRHAHGWNRYILSGAIAGASLAWSNDCGLPTCTLVVVLAIWLFWRSGELTGARLAVMLVFVPIAFMAVMTFATGGHPLKMLYYNFRDVAGDQYWFFGNDDSQWRIVNLKTSLILWPFVVRILLATMVVVKWPSYSRILVLSLCWATFLGGLLPTVGGHVDLNYMSAFVFTFNVAFVLSIAQVAALRFAQRLHLPSAQVLVMVPVVLGILVALPLGALRYRRAWRQAVSTYAQVPELGGFSGKDQLPLLNFARSAHKPFLEEYWGLPSAVRHEVSPWQVDLAIAALGSERNHAKTFLDHWDGYVTTMRTGGEFSGWVTVQYVSWATNENWWLYRTVLRAYEPILVMPNLIVWQKSASERQWPVATCRVLNGAQPQVHIDGPVAFYDLNLRYHLGKLPWHAHVMLQTNTTVFRGDSYGYTSINPKGTDVNFPVYVGDKFGQDLGFRFTPSRLMQTMVLESCTANRITSLVPHVLTHTTRSQAEVAAYGYPESDLQ